MPKPKRMESRLQVAIVSAGRSEKVAACLASVRKHLGHTVDVIVVDSKPSKESELAYRRFNVGTVVIPATVIGPSAARQIIEERAERDLILFLDDDNIVTGGAAESMLTHLDSFPEVDIVGGCWFELGGFEHRELGQNFHLGRDKSGPVVYKSFVSRGAALKMGLESVSVDAVLATMLVRRDVLERVGFDPQFNFYYELFDFFMQCKKQRVVVSALPGAVFEHYPGGYQGTTMRESSASEDRDRFEAKWGCRPIGPRDSAGAKKSK